MALVLTPALEDSLAFELLIIYLIARRTYRLVRGAPYQEARILTTIALYSLLLAITLLESYLLLPTYLLGVDGAIVVVAALLFVGHAERTVVFERGPQGAWTYRLSWVIGGLYLGLWVARLVLELVFFPQVLEFQTITAAPTLSALVALAAVDGLFALSTGLLLGRSLGVIRAHRKLPREPPAPATSPPLRSET